MITRESILNDPAVHNLTKDILQKSKDLDIVDCYHDVKLALMVLESELDKSLNLEMKNQTKQSNRVNYQPNRKHLSL